MYVYSLPTSDKNTCGQSETSGCYTYRLLIEHTLLLGDNDNNNNNDNNNSEIRGLACAMIMRIFLVGNSCFVIVDNRSL